MTYGICMIKGKPERREKALKMLQELSRSNELYERCGVKIFHDVFITFGWPDFIVIFKGENIELIKEAVVYIREKLRKPPVRDNISTSTLICTTEEEKNEKLRSFLELLKV